MCYGQRLELEIRRFGIGENARLNCRWSDMVGDLERQTDYYADMNRYGGYFEYFSHSSSKCL